MTDCDCFCHKGPPHFGPPKDGKKPEGKEHHGPPGGHGPRTSWTSWISSIEM